MAGDAHMLLARALGTLTEEEQATVLKGLLPISTLGLASSDWLARGTAALAATQLGQRVPASESVSLLVRLPGETHARLKAWSEANGHSMNTVVRGLLERFLDGQAAV